jgi:hypothetical protein
MADEPSIDEILASLDRLLNEGEGRNDEPTELPRQPSVEESAEETTEEPGEEAPKEAAEEPAEAPSLRFLMALDQTVSEPYNEVESDESKAGMAVAEAAAAASEKLAPAAGTGAAQEAAAEGSRRIVLTDAMMVDDIQQPLPLAMDVTAPANAVLESSTPVAVTPEPAAPAPSPIPDPSPETGAITRDEQDIQALVDQVTDDVCSAVAEQLPALIRQALGHRLSAFISEKTQNQDAKPEE